MRHLGVEVEGGAPKDLVGATPSGTDEASSEREERGLTVAIKA